MSEKELSGRQAIKQTWGPEKSIWKVTLQTKKILKEFEIIYWKDYIYTIWWWGLSKEWKKQRSIFIAYNPNFQKWFWWSWKVNQYIEEWK